VNITLHNHKLLLTRFSKKKKRYHKNLNDGNIEDNCKVVGEVIGRRWSLSILENLSTKEVIRFDELRRILPGISSTVLSERLLDLEREGLVTKKIYPEVPPKVEYRLTLLKLFSLRLSLPNWQNGREDGSIYEDRDYQRFLDKI